MKVKELAAELKLDAQELKDMLVEMGVEVKPILVKQMKLRYALTVVLSVKLPKRIRRKPLPRLLPKQRLSQKQKQKQRLKPLNQPLKICTQTCGGS